MKRILQTLSQKWPEYFIEGVVIIASILIAIALENWNEDLQEKEEQQTLVAALINDLSIKKDEMIADRIYGEKLLSNFDQIIDQIRRKQFDDSTQVALALRLLQNDQWSFQNETHIYSGASESEAWKALPDSLKRQISEIHRLEFTFLKNFFAKEVEYASACKLNYLVPNKLIDPNASLVAKGEIIARDYDQLNAYLHLIHQQLSRIVEMAERTENKLDQILANLHNYQSTIE